MDSATIRKVKADQAETIIEVVDPGKFKDNCTWPDWKVKFENYLSTIPGFNIVPLSYVVQDQAAPDCTTDFQGEFIAETIACTTLSDAHLQADTRKLHQLLKNYLVYDTDERWISSIEKSANDWDEFDALRRHCSGEGNVSRRIAMVDRLQDTLQYNSERALSFNTFLDNMQKMFNIFRDEGGPMADSTQVCEIFMRVQHPQLYDTVKALEVRSELYSIIYSEADNQLTAAVSKMP